jgi:hypothetical protein
VEDGNEFIKARILTMRKNQTSGPETTTKNDGEGRRPACPTPEEFLKFHRRELPWAERRALKNHLALCPGCRTDSSFVAGIIALERNLIRDLARLNRDRSLWGRPAFRYLSIFLLVAAVAVSTIFIGRRLPSAALRGNPSGRIALIAPAGSSPAGSAVEFRWIGDPRADAYVVEIFRENLDLVWKSEKVRTLSLTVPEPARRLLRKDSAYTWLVRGFFPDGRTIESLPLAFILR